MGQKNRHSNYSFESEIDSHVNNDPNFDLDEYIRRKSQLDSSAQLHQPDIEDREQSKFKNAVLIFLVFAAAFLWVNEWSVSQTWNSVFGSDESATSFEFAPPVIPDFEIPDVPAPPMLGNEAGLVNYLRGLEEAGLADVYSNSGNIAMYQTGVTVDYLNQMNEAGYLDDFSYSAIIGFYNGNVTVEYLDALSDAGYLEDFSYSAIIGLYNGDVTIDYLNSLGDAGYLDQFSYSAIIGLYNGDVTIDYLNQMNEAGYLEDFSYSAIIGLYNGGVTTDFINQLNENGLLDDMSYSDIIMAYNADN